MRPSESWRSVLRKIIAVDGSIEWPVGTAPAMAEPDCFASACTVVRQYRRHSRRGCGKVRGIFPTWRATLAARRSTSRRGKTAPARVTSRCGVGWGASTAGKASVRHRAQVAAWDESAPTPAGTAPELFLRLRCHGAQVAPIRLRHSDGCPCVPRQRSTNSLRCRNEAGWPGPWSEPTRCAHRPARGAAAHRGHSTHECLHEDSPHTIRSSPPLPPQ